jgi:starch phosphorylase
MIREWIHFLRRHDIRQHAVFLVDYDMLLAERIVEGVDVWINTPRRPWEASGTSGMKVLPNGGVNLSELDGWWAEAYQPDVGWALGDGKEHGDDPAWDAAEARQFYDILEREVIARFYDRGDDGLPRKWIAMMRESMARVDAGVFGESNRSRVHREVLPAGRSRLPQARGFSRHASAANLTVAQSCSRALVQAPFRSRALRDCRRRP